MGRFYLTLGLFNFCCGSFLGPVQVAHISITFPHHLDFVVYSHTPLLTELLILGHRLSTQKGLSEN